MEDSFPFCIVLAPHAAISNRQVVMTCGIRRPELLHYLKRRDRVGILFIENQSHPQPEKRIYKPGIEPCGPRKMFNGLGNLLRLAGKLSKHVLRAGVGGVNL